MIEIEDKDYARIARMLKDEIEDSDFFNGTLEYDTERFYSTLTATAIVYRKSVSMPEGTFSSIDDIVPVWWNFTTTADGLHTLNDFSFETLREFI